MFITVYNNIKFWGVKETSHWDVSFTRPKQCFIERKLKIIILGVIYFYVSLPINRISMIRNKTFSPRTSNLWGSTVFLIVLKASKGYTTQTRKNTLASQENRARLHFVQTSWDMKCNWRGHPCPMDTFRVAIFCFQTFRYDLKVAYLVKRTFST